MNEKVDLETAIMLAWQTADDLDLLYKHHGDHPVPMSEDEVSIAILGIKRLHEMRMEALMDTYCRKFELNQYCTDERKLAARELANLGGVFEEKKGKKKK